MSKKGINYKMNFQLLEKIGLQNFDLSYILIAMLIMIAAGWIIAIIALSKYSKLSKKYKRFMGGNDAKALESYITELIDLNQENVEKIAENSAKIENLYKKQRYNFQKIGINKYDAFQEMGGNLSFALALLDENDNGFIINSVHNIQSSYCYAKEVKNGTCSINLSKDEEVALNKALNYK